MRNRHILYCIAIAGIAIGCTPRKNETIPAVAAPVAGTGGNTELRITAKRFQKNIDTGTVYIKYNNATTYTDTKYDDSGYIKIQNGRPMVIFDSLKRGNYYFFINCRDLTLTPPHDSLFGYGMFSIVDTIKQQHDVYINVMNRFDAVYSPK